MDILANLFTVFAALVLPIGAGIWLSVKKKGYMKPVLFGAFTFFMFQTVGRALMLSILRTIPSYIMFSQTQPILYAFFIAATAGLFEEGGRWLVMTYLMKDRRRFNDGIAFGVGHGGIEAVLIVGLMAVMMLFIQLPAVTAGQIAASGFERINTMVIQIGLSVMVFKGVVFKNPLWVFAAFILHTAIDMGAVMLQQAGASILAIEAIIFVIALASLSYVIVDYKKYKGGETQ